MCRYLSLVAMIIFFCKGTYGSDVASSYAREMDGLRKTFTVSVQKLRSTMPALSKGELDEAGYIKRIKDTIAPELEALKSSIEDRKKHPQSTSYYKQVLEEQMKLFENWELAVECGRRFSTTRNPYELRQLNSYIEDIHKRLDHISVKYQVLKDEK